MGVNILRWMININGLGQIGLCEKKPWMWEHMLGGISGFYAV